MKSNLKQKNKGFTLVETLVAISIFTVSILGMMSILASGVSNTNYTKQKIIASYLAQEGIEYIKNMRDTYVLYPAVNGGWNSFYAKLSSLCLSSNASPNNFCGFDNSAPGPNSNIFACSGNVCELYLYNGTYSTDHSNINAVDSGFLRKIQISQISAGNEIKVSSTVLWTQGSGNYSVILSEDLFNWMP